MKVILILMSLYSQPEKSLPEQIAFDYFIENILDESYKGKKMVFTGLTDENKLYIGPFGNCFQSEKQFGEYIEKTTSNSRQNARIDFTETRFLKRTKSWKRKPLNLHIQRAIQIDDNQFVHISLYKHHHFVDHYLVRILDNKVADHCYSNEYI